MPLSVWSTTMAPNDSPSRPCSTAASVGVGAGALGGPRPPVGVAHQLGELGQGRAHGIRHLGAAAGGLADDQAEAVDEPAQRRGDVGVGGGDRRVLGLRGRSPSKAV